MSIDVKKRVTQKDLVAWEDLNISDTFEYGGRCYMQVEVPNFDEDRDVLCSLDLVTGQLCLKSMARVRKVDFILYEQYVK